jgi:hypothetical protein
MSYSQLVQDAQTAAQYTGVDANVILAQMVAENGWDVPSTNNFGNIEYYGGQGQTGYFTGSNGQKFATYDTPDAGLAAYVNLINGNYGQIAQAKGDTAQLQALQASPWDANHYANIDGVYNSVMAKGGTQGAKAQTLNLGQQGSTTTGSPLSKVTLLDWVLIGVAAIILLAAFL